MKKQLILLSIIALSIFHFYCEKDNSGDKDCGNEIEWITDKLPFVTSEHKGKVWTLIYEDQTEPQDICTLDNVYITYKLESDAIDSSGFAFSNLKFYGVAYANNTLRKQYNLLYLENSYGDLELQVIESLEPYFNGNKQGWIGLQLIIEAEINANDENVARATVEQHIQYKYIEIVYHKYPK